MPEYLFMVGTQTIKKFIPDAHTMRRFAMDLYRSYGEVIVVKYPWRVRWYVKDYRLLGVVYWQDGDFYWAHRQRGREYHSRIRSNGTIVQMPYDEYQDKLPPENQE